MDRYDLALIGFGGVNRALAELIDERGPALAAELGFELRVVAITDLRLGSLMQSDGIDLSAVLSLGPGADFAGFAGATAEPRNEYVIRNTTADIVVEATFTNPVDGEPAISHVRWALESGKHVTTTNKGPVALAGAELRALAADRGVRFEYEGAVLSGTPILRLAERMFAGLRIRGVQGILNGTSNYVLGRMEAGLSLHDAVAEAQGLGYAEADPTADIEGSDVQLKVVILANEVLGADLTTADVERRGLSTVSAAEIAEAQRRGPSLEAHRRRPSQRRRIGHPRASRPSPCRSTTRSRASRAPTNAVAFDTDLLGTVTVSGPGAGRIETAYALLSDLIAIHAGRGAAHRGRHGCLSSSSPPSRPACSPASPPCSTRTTAPRSAASRSTTAPTSTGSSSAPASASRSRARCRDSSGTRRSTRSSRCSCASARPSRRTSSSARPGKTIRQARKEVRRAITTLSLSAEAARSNAGEVIPFDAFEGSEHRRGWFTREPLGIILAITPYNDALNLVAHKLGPAIAGRQLDHPEALRSSRP